MADKKRLILQAIKMHNMAEGNEDNQVILPYVKSELKVTKMRGWRFDYSYPELRIAIEVHGGIFTKGRHVRPLGFMEDRRKMNEAQLQGWIVLEFPVPDIENTPFDCVEQIARAIELRRRSE